MSRAAGQEPGQGTARTGASHEDSRSADDDDDDSVPPTLVPRELPAGVVLAARPPPVSRDANEGRGLEVAPGAATADRVQATPVTVLTGFLGSGKTTLVKRLVELLGAEKKTVAVINNEEAATGIEEQLRVSAGTTGDGEEEDLLLDVVEIGNGCVCCSVRNDLVRALEALLKRRHFDYVLVECSGLANPGEVASIFWVDSELQSAIYLDGVVCVVDAAHVERHLGGGRAESAQVVQQLAYADAVLINKCDLVSGRPGVLDGLAARVRAIAPSAALHRCTRSEVPLSAVLGLHAYEGDAASSLGPELGALLRRGPDVTAAAAAAACAHDGSISTVVLEVRGGEGLDLDRFRSWLAQLAWGEDDAVAATASMLSSATGLGQQPGSASPQLFRYKAVLASAGDRRRHYMQGVHALFELSPGPEWPAGEERVSRMMLTGRGLDVGELQRAFESCSARHRQQ